jgi:hypothetical protein
MFHLIGSTNRLAFRSTKSWMDFHYKSTKIFRILCVGCSPVRLPAALSTQSRLPGRHPALRARPIPTVGDFVIQRFRPASADERRDKKVDIHRTGPVVTQG